MRFRSASLLPACVYGATLAGSMFANMATCTCEKVLYTRPALYNQACDSSRKCLEGKCFRPCDYFLHVSTCPEERCMWNTTSNSCVLLPSSLVYRKWNELTSGAAPNEDARSRAIIAGSPKEIFPMNFEKFTLVAKTYRVQGYDVEELFSLVDLFYRVDKNYDGFVTRMEFDELLTRTLVDIEAYAIKRRE